MALSKCLSSNCIKAPAYAHTWPIFSQRPTCAMTEEDQTTGGEVCRSSEKVASPAETMGCHKALSLRGIQPVNTTGTKITPMQHSCSRLFSAPEPPAADHPMGRWTRVFLLKCGLVLVACGTVPRWHRAEAELSRAS